MTVDERRGASWLRGLGALAALGVCVLLAACSNGGDESAQEAPPSAKESSRFLAQASFGANDISIQHVSQIGYEAWIRDQFSKPQALHREHLDRRAQELAVLGYGVVPNDFLESFWIQAISGDDQLRQRATFALSQIFVVSLADNTLQDHPRGIASYVDMLGSHAFGNYRDLLEAVTLHPMMGSYLSAMRNQKESGSRIPDENFAREIMQLFSIGLVELNIDGSVKLDAQGRPIETYGPSDIAGLARVFTGWSWYAGPQASDRTLSKFMGFSSHPDRDWRPMQSYAGQAADADFHSVGEKRFLGTTIAAQSQPDAEGDLRIALDVLFLHPNVGPFIGRHLIQRMVTSNPSPAYISRVAAAFNNNGQGIRGDMKAVWRAILLDPEARAVSDNPSGGKLREPVLRLAAFFRAFGATSRSGRFTGIDNTDDPSQSLGQTPMRSPSVFNFFRPGYTPPGSAISTAGLVAPEMQLVHEVSVAGYINYMQGWIQPNLYRDVRQNYAAEMALAADAEALVRRIDLLLMGGQMPAGLLHEVTEAVEDRVVPVEVRDANGAITNAAQVEAARQDRVCIAILLAMSSPDYLIQR
jgi:uncharacterized protein (DUF1800 family)